MSRNAIHHNGIIVIEGPDGVGKSSLASALADGIDAEIIPFGPPDRSRHPFDIYWEAIDQIAEKSKDHLVICDRFHVGELVYGNLLRGGTDLTSDQAALISLRLKGLGAVLVHASNDLDETIRRLAARDGDSPDPKSGAAIRHMRSIRASFNAWIGQDDRHDGILPGSWWHAIVDGNLDELVGTLRSTAMAGCKFSRRGWIGEPLATVLILVDGRFFNVGNLEWIVRSLRELGIHGQTAIAQSDSDIRLDSRQNQTVVILGDNSESDFILGFDFKSLKIRVDEYLYDTDLTGFLREAVSDHFQKWTRTGLAFLREVIES